MVPCPQNGEKSHMILRNYFLLLLCKVDGASGVQSWPSITHNPGWEATQWPTYSALRVRRRSILLRVSPQLHMWRKPTPPPLVSNSERLFRAVPQSPMIPVWQPLNLGKSCMKPTCHHRHCAQQQLRETHSHSEADSSTSQKKRELEGLAASCPALSSRQTGMPRGTGPSSGLRWAASILGAVRRWQKECLNNHHAQNPGPCPAGLK